MTKKKDLKLILFYFFWKIKIDWIHPSSSFVEQLISLSKELFQQTLTTIQGFCFCFLMQTVFVSCFFLVRWNKTINFGWMAFCFEYFNCIESCMGRVKFLLLLLFFIYLFEKKLIWNYFLEMIMLPNLICNNRHNIIFVWIRMNLNQWHRFALKY